MHEFTFGSLFSGIGGLDLGLERSGMRCAWQVEKNAFCQRVLMRHWPKIDRYDDITKITGAELQHVDLIAGGFPCQDVSLAGLRKGIGNGTRSGLYAEMLRIVRLLRPRFVLMENVSGLLIPTAPGGPAPLARVLGDLAEIGYDAEWQGIPAAAFGAPHIRDRIFILAYANSHSGRDEIKKAKANEPDQIREVYYSRENQQDQRIGRASRHPSHDPWWDCEPGVDRVADGIPCQMDRLRGLGNAVVPQVGEYLGRAILAAA